MQMRLPHLYAATAELFTKKGRKSIRKHGIIIRYIFQRKNPFQGGYHDQKTVSHPLHARSALHHHCGTAPRAFLRGKCHQHSIRGLGFRCSRLCRGSARLSAHHLSHLRRRLWVLEFWAFLFQSAHSPLRRADPFRYALPSRRGSSAKQHRRACDRRRHLACPTACL